MRSSTGGVKFILLTLDIDAYLLFDPQKHAESEAIRVSDLKRFFVEI